MATEAQLIQEIADEGRWNLLQLRRFEVKIVEAFQVFREHGIEPILIKGWAAAQNYPSSKHRNFADIDLAVAAEDYDRSFKLTHSAPLNILNIDIHRELRHLDTASWSELFGRSRLLRIDDLEVRILSPEDHLRVLSTHWLTDGGQYKERLWDIYYAIENRPNDFDWDVCLGSVSETRRNWILMATSIAQKYLGLDVNALPFADELPPVPKWMANCLEKEWSNDVRLRSLHTCLNDRRLFFEQVKKRVPPNPIQATIESEAKFDKASRVPMQIKSVMSRLGPSLNRVGRSIADKLRRSQPS